MHTSTHPRIARQKSITSSSIFFVFWINKAGSQHTEKRVTKKTGKEFFFSVEPKLREKMALLKEKLQPLEEIRLQVCQPNKQV